MASIVFLNLTECDFFHSLFRALNKVRIIICVLHSYAHEHSLRDTCKNVNAALEFKQHLNILFYT